MYERLEREQIAHFNHTGDLVNLATADFAHDAKYVLDYLEGLRDTPPLYSERALRRLKGDY